ncbi:MAG: acyl-CoA dehydratase activase [Desulfotomaculum sp.]|nr:acyl-CoA dehydratase activase [Desulfotomaculum sp.]
MRVYLGLDVGSVSIDVAVVSEKNSLLQSQYLRHNGRVDELLLAAVKAIDKQYDIIAIAATGVGAKRVALMFGAALVNEVIALMQGVVHQNPATRTIIDIGGQDSKLILLAANIEKKSNQAVLTDFAMNNFCAAGTGSFLDQQALRLNLTIEEFSNRALLSDKAARVAGRCSVFAKTDMIHLQQKGTPPEDIIAGLCVAVANNFRANIAKGKKIITPVVFTGGVCQNPGVLKSLRAAFSLSETALYVPDNAVILGALGAVQWLLNNPEKRQVYKINHATGVAAGVAIGVDVNEAKKQLQPLELKQAAGLPKKFQDKLITAPEPVFLGVDIGSISTNIVLLNQSGDIIFKKYLMTAGQPIKAVKEGLNQLHDFYGDTLNIAGVSTTGSARFLIGDLIGADVIKNEITTHARAATFLNPAVDTIFEIGGQDSKYIHLNEGVVDNFTMNKACAAGTGSFLEEQAQKLAIKIKDQFAKLALASSNPLDCGEKCTVFMETEVVKYFQDGQKIADITAGLAYSIVHNYLHKVVENRPIGTQILFQGGVAANQAVVAAFEQVTQKTIQVPEHHEVMGALGCCLLAQTDYLKNKIKKSKFKGLNYLNRPFQTSVFECKSCDNHCEINKIKLEGNKALYYGGRCEKYEVLSPVAAKSMPDYFALREKMLDAEAKTKTKTKKLVIGIPRVHVFYEYFPFFKTFFEKLGFEVLASPPSNRDIIKKGINNVRTATCFPTKLAHGHVSWLVDRAKEGAVDLIFIPSVRETQSCSLKHHVMSNHCDFVIFIPEMTNESLAIEKQGIKILKPELHFRLGETSIKRELYKMIKNIKSIGNYSKKTVDNACTAAFEQYYLFRKTMLLEGQKALSKLAPAEKAVILIGKIHNTADKLLTMDLPKIWRNLGVHCFPMDFFDFYNSDDVNEAWHNTTLAMSQRMMVLTDIVRKIPNVYPVYVTNYSCVNDSMVSYFIKGELGGKPALYLEIDEHSAEAGIITRCEAFLDAIKPRANTAAYQPQRIVRKPFSKKEIQTLYIPYVARGSRMWEYAFKRCGINAVSLPEPDQASVACAKQFTTGEECYPCILITGDIFKKILAAPAEENIAFYSPGSCGSCRYDSFNPLHNVALNKLSRESNLARKIVIVDDFAKTNPEFKKIITSPQYMFASVRGFLAADILNRLLMNIRPYELEKGITERIFETCIDTIGLAIEKGRGFSKALGAAVASLLAIPVDRQVRRPRIGVMGEAYIRNVDFSSDDLIRKLEALGAEVVTPPVHELIKYTLYKGIYYTQKEGKYLQQAIARFRNKIIDQMEIKYVQPIINYLGYDFDPCLLNHIKKSGITLKAGTHMGTAIEMINYKAVGIINAIPFNCVPGMVVESLMERFRSEYPHIPFITLVCQGQNQANNQIRLETFVHQCQEKVREEQ